MTKFLSDRQQSLKVGISSYAESKTVLQTIGKVGIGTTNAGGRSLYVIGDTQITGVITAASFIGNGSQLTDINASSIIGVMGYADVSGIATLAGVSTSVIGGIASVTQLNVSGISTLGITIITNLTSQQLNVSGISTLTQISAGGSTGTNQYVLSSTGIGLSWQSVTSVGAISGITIS